MKQKLWRFLSICPLKLIHKETVRENDFSSKNPNKTIVRTLCRLKTCDKVFIEHFVVNVRSSVMHGNS